MIRVGRFSGLSHATIGRADGWLAATALRVVLSLCCAPPVLSQSLEPNLWGTDGAVRAVVRSGNTIYVGGSFTMVGPNTGGGVPVDRVTGEAISPYPQVAGVVRVVVPDGSDGWYIGGSFVAVGGVPKSNLAHILAGGQVASWAPDPDGEVLALALDGQTLYAGGAFNHIGGEARRHLASLDASSGAVHAWDPGPDARVRAILLHRSRLYVGGDFATIGGQTRNSLAELGPGTGVPTAWNPDVGFFGEPGSVRALAARGDTVYVGGMFWTVGLHLRRHVGAVDATTGLATDWDPHATGPDDRYYGDPYVRVLAVGTSSIYVGGHFTGIGSQVRGGLAEVDLATGLATGWNPDPGPWVGDLGPDVTAMMIAGDSLLVSGGFSTIAGVERRYCAKLALTSGAASAWNPGPITPAWVLTVSEGAVYVGGEFTGMGREWQRRNDLAAFDATTGRLKDWNPSPNGFGIQSVILSHGKIYVCGFFSTIGGQYRYGLAALDTLTGAATDWFPTTNDWVTTLELGGDTLYAGGNFTTMDGVPRGRLASFDLMTGEMTSWNPIADTDVYDLAVSGSTVYVAGFFGSMGGVPRKYIAAVDGITGAVTDWNPSADSWVDAVAVVGERVFVGGTFRTIGGQSRERLAAIDVATGNATDWIADANSRVNALAPIGDSLLYVGGLFSTIAGATRSGLAAVGIATGALGEWNPDPGGGVSTISAFDNTLYVGGGFTRASGLPSASLAAFSLLPTGPPPSPAPATVLLLPTTPNPVRASATIRFALPSPGPVDLAVFDVQGRRVTSLLKGETRAAGWHDVPVRADGWPAGFYLYRLQAAGEVATRRMVVIP